MFKVLELSGLFVCLGGIVKIFSAWGGGQKKLLGCGLLGGGGVSTQADTIFLMLHSTSLAWNKINSNLRPLHLFKTPKNIPWKCYDGASSIGLNNKIIHHFYTHFWLGWCMSTSGSSIYRKKCLSLITFPESRWSLTKGLNEHSVKKP